MASLYNIEQELLDIFETVENNEGEITDEQLELLAIKEEELKDKLESYCKAISIWSSDADCCKNEKKRINSVQKTYENRIERLKKVMLNAVQMFGQTGKTNKFIELSTVKLFTRSSKSIDVNENRVDLLIDGYTKLISELNSQGILYTGEDVDLQGIIDIINANLKAELGDDFVPFTVFDLHSLKVDVVSSVTLASLLTKENNIIRNIGSETFDTNIKYNTDKDSWKFALEISKDTPDISTIAKFNHNQSLQIK